MDDAFSSYNRTILELKPGKAESTVRQYRNLQSHHFGIETKQAMPEPPTWAAYNRTILELKLFFSGKDFAIFQLTIAPFWNWNNNAASPPTPPMRLQSHHFGIETSSKQQRDAD